MKFEKLELSKDFEDFIRLLNRRGVRYLIIGGYSVAYHGYPRYTKDIDLLIAVAPDNAKKLFRQLRNLDLLRYYLRIKTF